MLALRRSPRLHENPRLLWYEVVIWTAPCEVASRLLRKEVIQPQVPLRLPCYDFTPVTSHTMGGYPPEGLKHRLPVQLTSMV